MRELQYIVPEEFNNAKISSFLKSQDYSEKVLKILRNHPQTIFLNGQEVYMNQLVVSGDLLVVRLLDDGPSDKIIPVKMPLDILYEDQDILVVNKPADMPIHPSLKNYDNTLANAVAFYMSGKEENFVYRCINRLDRDTSGITIIAKNILSASILQQDMKDRLISRTYFAIVEGSFDEKVGTIDAAIAREGDSIITRCIDFRKGQNAVTHYEVLDTADISEYIEKRQYDTCIDGYIPQQNISLVRCSLETGRTHQIRVHMKYIGHPLVGDGLYNPNNKLIDRQALHAGSISFRHPITKKIMEIQASFPNDMQKLINQYFEV